MLRHIENSWQRQRTNFFVMQCINFIATMNFYFSESYQEFNMEKSIVFFLFQNLRKLTGFILQAGYLARIFFLLFLHAMLILSYILHYFWTYDSLGKTLTREAQNLHSVIL